MARYDIESFCDDVQTALSDNLNTAITAINTEKNDSLSLASLSSGAFFFQSLVPQVVNQNPFVFYRLDSLEVVQPSPESHIATRLTMQVMVILEDDGNDALIIKRMLRYQRALIDLFTSRYSRVSKIGKIKVSGITPFPIDALAGRANISQVSGVTLEVFLP